MLDINEVLLEGKVKDLPHLRYTKIGKTLCSFILIVNTIRRNAAGNPTKVSIEVPVNIWNEKLAEKWVQLLKPKRKVFVKGSFTGGLSIEANRLKLI